MRVAIAVGAVMLAGCTGLGSAGVGSGAGAAGGAAVVTGRPAGTAGPVPAGTLLRRAEDQVAAAQYRSALALYDEFLRGHPDDPVVPRVRAARTAVERLIASLAEVERLRRETDTRQGEIDRLKADLDRLRRIDLRQTPPTP